MDDIDKTKMLARMEGPLPDDENLPMVNKCVDEDHEYTRTKLKEIIEQSEEVLEYAADIAKETGEPRSIEVYAGLAKTLGDLAKSVMDNNKIKSAIDKELKAQKNALGLPIGDGDQPTSITQNNQTIFVGTTKELHDMINADVIEGESETIDEERKGINGPAP